MIVFAHDHIFKYLEGDFYSSGGLSDKILSRYVKYYGEVIVEARIVKKGENRKSKITNSKIDIEDYRDLKSYKKNIKRCNMLIARMPSRSGVLGIVWAICYKKKYVIELVEDPIMTYWHYGGLKGKAVMPMVTAVTYFLVKHAPYVVYVSRNFLQQRFPTKGKQLSCPDVDLELPDNKVLDNRIKRIRRNNNEFTLGLIGSMDVNYRGHGTAIKAIAYLKREYKIVCKLKFLGGGKKDRFEVLAKEEGVENQVEFSGILPAGDEVLNWIDNIDILVMPTLQETLGRAVIEAMSRGCPVLGSIETAISEQIGSDCLFHARRHIELARLIVNMHCNKKYMEYCAYENFYRSFKYSNEENERKRDEFYLSIK